MVEHRTTPAAEGPASLWKEPETKPPGAIAAEDQSLKVPSATRVSTALHSRTLQYLQSQPVAVGWHLWQAGSVAWAGNLKLRDSLKRDRKSCHWCQAVH